MPTEGEMHPSFKHSRNLQEEMMRSKPYIRENRPVTEEPAASYSIPADVKEAIGRANTGKAETPRIVDVVSVGFIQGEGWFNFCPCGRRMPCAPGGGPPELTFEQVMESARRQGLRIIICSEEEAEEEPGQVRGVL